MGITPLQLENFLRALAIDRGHLGLVVVEQDPGKLSLPESVRDAATANIDERADAEALLDTLADCARRGRWLRLDLVDGTMPGRVYDQLRAIAATGHFRAAAVGAPGDLIDLRWPREAKIIVVAGRAELGKMAVPTFLNLFGPVLRGA